MRVRDEQRRDAIYLTTGITLLLGGVGIFAWDQVRGVLYAPTGTIVGCALAIIGVLMLCFNALERRSAATNRAYRFGYDMGYHDGDRDRARRDRKHRPVVVALRSRSDQSI